MRGNKFSKNQKESDPLLENQYDGGDDEGAGADKDDMEAKPDMTDEEALELAKKRQAKFNEILEKRKAAQAE